MYKTFTRPILFLCPPEQAHQLVFFVLKMLFALPGVKSLFASAYSLSDPKLERKVFGLHFKNPVGLAAGFDKDAKLFGELEAFGFGFIEIGTVTPLAQSGNEKPRMFRLPEDEAIINRMGFNNEGASAAADRLRKRKRKILIGGNIGKNKNTPNIDAVEDFKKCFIRLFGAVDYFVVNVSSPNTPGLRALQEKGPLLEILNALMQLNRDMSATANCKVIPLLLKIAPDLTNEALDDIIAIVKDAGIDGIVATNTTIARSGLQTSPERITEMGAGGLSGKPLSNRATEVIRYLHEKSGGSFPIIASGGIHTGADAREKLDAGASLVQIYTGFIYEGPGIVKNICRELIK